jgi:hypothetical protein
MRLRLLIVLAGLCGGSIANVANAAPLPAPQVEYSADRIMETSAGKFTGKVYVTKDKERTETDMGGMQSVMILRKDKQLGWMIMPSHKMYQTLDFAKAREQSGAAPDDQIDITEVGSETVSGLSTTKYKMVMKDGSAGGFIWISKEGIPVKMDMLSKDSRSKTRITVTLENVKIGPQDPQLFELPAGLTAMPSMGAFGGRR